jgi:excisionase family DNA binding protein
MELITITEASRQVGVSDKTLRRAISDGTLTAQPRLHPNKPILIAPSDLEAYIASRHASTSDVQTSPTPVDTQTQERITALEQEIESLRARIHELERIVLLQSGQPHEVHPPVQPEPQRRRTKQEEPAFSIADFSRKWQEEYRCEAVLKDVRAIWKLQPYAEQGTHGEVYRVASLDWQPTSNKRKIPDVMRERSILLLQVLADKAEEAMNQAGWTQAGTSEAGKPLYRQPTKKV